MFAVDTSPLTSGGPVDDRIVLVYGVMFWIAVVVGIGVGGLVLFGAFRFRRKADDEEPKQVHGHTKLEIVWTAIPFVILIALFGLTAANMGFVADAPAGAKTVEVTGSQYSWTYVYPWLHNSAGRPVSTVTKMVVPSDTPIALDLMSKDVNHSFYVPNLAGQMNAIPGQTNHMWLQARVGNYYGQCTELCGTGHAIMLIEVVALDPPQYQAWKSCVEQKPSATSCTQKYGS